MPSVIPDRSKLHALAALSISQAELRAAGFLQLCKSADLFRVGYIVSHWMRPGDGMRLDEYNPPLSDLPRVTLDNFEAQVRLHRALGFAVSRPGKHWNEAPGLFDDFDIGADGDEQGAGPMVPSGRANAR